MTATRTKHVPTRRCVACRSEREKQELIRLVRTADGHVQVDEGGRSPGRGAYLCSDTACWDKALDSPALSSALRVKLIAADQETLREFARTMVRLAVTTGGTGA